MAHTPGPWRRSSLAPLYIISKDEANPICSIGEYRSNGDIDSVFENAEANARLIAASPKLLEACKAAYLRLLQQKSVVEDVDLLNSLETAIAKAEEKQ